MGAFIIKLSGLTKDTVFTPIPIDPTSCRKPTVFFRVLLPVEGYFHSYFHWP